MKVLRVIVDEVPEACDTCRWFSDYYGYDFVTYKCRLRDSLIDRDNLDKLHTRPDWCPLVSMDDLGVPLDKVIIE